MPRAWKGLKRHMLWWGQKLGKIGKEGEGGRNAGTVVIGRPSVQVIGFNPSAFPIGFKGNAH